MFAAAWQVTKTAFAGWWADRALSLGAAIAFYTLFSLAPMLLMVIAVAGLAFGRDAAEGAVVAQVGSLIGTQEAAAVQAMVASAGNVGSGIVGTIIGVVTLIIVGTGAFVELQDDLNLIWKVEPAQRSGFVTFVRTRLLSLALLAAIGFILLVSLAVDAGVSALGGYLAGRFSAIAAVAHVVNFIAGLAIAIVFFALIFKLLPDVHVGWRDAAAGAVATGVLFTIGKFAIGFYIGKSGLASSYGAAASIITILLWIYYSSQILLFGAELTKAYAESRRRGPRGVAP